MHYEYIFLKYGKFNVTVLRPLRDILYLTDKL